MPIDSLARRELAHELALRYDPAHNKDIHINTFALLTSCSIDTLETILRIFIEETNIHRRYTRVGELANVNLLGTHSIAEYDVAPC